MTTTSGDSGTYPGFTDQLTQHLDYTALRHSDRAASAWLPVRDDLRDADGALHRGVLGYLVDATAGLVCGMAAVPSWVVTSDLQFRVLAPPLVGPLRADARVRRPGRRQSLGEVRVHDEGAGDQVVAIGTVNHLVIARDDDLDVPADMPIGVRYVRADPANSAPPAPLGQLLGLRHADGAVEMPIEGVAVNPLGFLHGGLIAVLVEEAVRSTLDAPVGDMTIRFVGPVADTVGRATVEVLSGPDGDIALVDICDASGRIGAIASARPGPSR